MKHLLSIYLIYFGVQFSIMLPAKHTMLCLGDSYTIGEAVAENETFPAQTVALLKKQKIEFESPLIVAKTGWTTDELQHAITEKKISDNFDYVTLLIGVNNQYRGRDTDNYRKEFVELLNTAIRFANGNRNHVFVLSIPDWGLTPFGANDKRGEETIGKEIDIFNAINKEETVKAQVNYIDITPVSRKAKTNPELTATDGLHPSASMYKMWSNLLADEIRKTMRQ